VSPGLVYAPSTVPAGASGKWAIDLVVQPERDPSVTAGEDPRPACFHYRPGTYRRLRRGDITFMTDLYDEWYTQCAAMRESQRRGGRVLVTGLGLGLVVDAMLGAADSRVTQVTIVEYSADVIRLVGPHLKARWGSKVEVVEADAFEWKPSPGERFSVGWHDVWPDPHGDAVRDSVAKLEAHHQEHCDWQGSWPTEYRQADGDAAASATGN